jgi:hypothetical protein
MKILRVGVVLLCAVTLSSADDPWKNAAYEKWNEKDVQKVLTDSPWGHELVTKTVDVAADKKADRRGSGVTQYDRPEQKPVEFVQVVWWSAKTMRRAVLRKAILMGAKVPADQAKAFTETPMEDLVVVVWGKPETVAGMARLEPEELKKAAHLDSPRLKKRIEPIEAAAIEEGNARPDKIRFHFPRKLDGEDTVTDKDSRLIFRWRLVRPKEKLEDAKVFEVVFSPNKMVSGAAADF